jgi:hypothetical protein
MHKKKRGLDSAFLVSEEADRDDRKRIRKIKKNLRNKQRAENPRQESNITDKRVSVAPESSTRGDSFSNSSTFFSRLQDQVHEGINVAKKNPSDKNDSGKSKRSSQGLKL